MNAMKTVTLSVILFVFICGLNENSLFAQEHTMTARELVIGSELVVVGQVKSVRSEWSDDRSFIFSDVTIEVEEYVKGGQAGKSVTVRHLGGEVGEVGEFYSHTARFQAEEEVLVFLDRDPRGTLRVAGGEHGKFRITRDRVTGQRMVEGRAPLENVTRDLRTIQRE